MSYRHILVTAALLLMFAVVGTAIVAFTYDTTADRIAANEREAMLHSLQEILPADRYDNKLFSDTIRVQDPALLGSKTPVTVYRARRDGKPVAAIFTSVAPDGYAGPIRLLVGVNMDGTLAGVRVIAENETPGLGDNIETSRSDWILKFAGRSLTDPGTKGWHVKRDGGVFDQFTGATITPRAVVKAIHKTLIYFARNRDRLFTPPPGTLLEPAAPSPAASKKNS